MEQFRVNAKQGKRKIKLNVSLGDSTWRGFAAESTSTRTIVIKRREMQYYQDGILIGERGKKCNSQQVFFTENN